MDEVIPLARLRASIWTAASGLLASEPATYLAREADREDLVRAEEAARAPAFSGPPACGSPTSASAAETLLG